MKKILNALFLTLFAVLTFSSCSDVPSPYDIIKGDFQLTGEGTQKFPYTISDLKKITGGKADGKTVAWVEAYIVAGIKSSANLSINSASDVVFGTQPADVKATAILIADSSTESDYTKCSAVNLNGKVVGCSDVKAALNLVENNTIELPRLIKFKGTLVDNTWGLPGLKDVTAAILEDGTLIGEGGSDIPTDENNPFGLDDSNPLNEINADFEEQPNFVQEKDYNSNLNYDYSLEGWKNIAFVGDRKWTGVVFKDNTKYIQASANKGSAETYTSWFVSPAFTVDNIKDKTIEFDCAGAYFYATTTLKVYFLELVNGVMQKTEIPVTGIPTSGTNYDWVKGIKIELKGQTGKIGFIGFEYVAEGGEKKSTTYQIDNIKSGKSEQGGGDEEEVVKVTKDAAYEETFAENVGRFTIAAPIGELSYVWKVDTERKYLKGSCYNKGAVVAEGWVISPVIDLTSSTKTTLTFMQTSFSEGLANEFMLKVKIDGTDTWNDLTFDLTAGSWAELATTVDLSEYDAKKIQLAFVCKNENTTKSNTWEIWNFKVFAGEGGGDVPGPSGDNLLTNGNLETWESNAPTGWIAENGVQESTLKNEGNYSLKVTSASKTKSLTQIIPVVANTKYKLSYYYLDNDSKARSRIYSAWLDATDKDVTDQTSKTLMQPDDYSTDNTEWKKVEFEVTAPATATQLRFRVSTYKENSVFGGFVYYDNFSVIEVK